MGQILGTSSEILKQLSDLAGKLSDDQYRQDLAILNNNSIGKHYRHIVEFISILFKAQGSGLVEYDKREHDTVLETDRSQMIHTISELEAKLQSPPLHQEMKLKVSYDLASDESVEVSTCWERELIYNIEHAIHHMAIIRIALNSNFPGIEVNKHFGIAYSTVKYLNA